MNTASSVKKYDDYFANHRVAVRWPFTIYHHSITRHLSQAIAAANAKAPKRVLVFGCGLFHERSLFETGNWNVVLVDSDARLANHPAITCLDSLHYSFVHCSDPGTLRVLSSGFDLIMAKEVIEHIVPMAPYFEAFQRLLKPTGTLWLSTPNYGGFTLPLAEQTLLELFARLQGFSRRHIHPNKYSEKKLREELKIAGFTDVHVAHSRFDLALLATAGVARKAIE